MRESGSSSDRRFTFTFILSLIAILLISTIPGVAMATSSWEEFQKDGVNSGKTTDLAPLNPTKAWKVFTHTDDWGMSGVDVAPIVADGKVFVIDARGYAWAFDAKSGEEIWNRSLSCEGWQFQLATPAYGDGRVFFATNDGHVYALDPETGDEIWSNRIAATYDQLNTPVTYADGKVYVGSYKSKSDNGMNDAGVYYCLDSSNGNLVWNRTSTTGKGYYWAGAAVIGDYLVYGDLASVLTCVYRGNGTLVDEINITTDVPFNHSDAGAIKSSVAYGNSSVYFTSEGGYAWRIGFDENSGQFIATEGWSKDIGYSCSTPVVHEGRVYLGTGSMSVAGRLYCLNASDGSEEWSFEPNGGIKASPAISIQGEDSYIYFTTNCVNGSVYCIDENGNELWDFTTEEAGASGGYILQGVAISDGYVYFGNDGGYVYGLKETPILWEGEVTLTENTTVNVTAHNSGESYEINQTTALGALDAAAEKGGFNYTISDEWYASYGSFLVDSIAGVENTGMENWLYWVNYPDDTMPTVGVNLYELEEGDVVTFYYGGWTVTPDNASKVVRIHVHIQAPSVPFDTGTPDNPYPSIFGTHNGTITPNQTITVSKLYTYPCPGTGGHTEFVKIWDETTGECAVAHWNGYIGDWHNLSFDTTLTLRKGVVYNYTIRTGSYPQIHHTDALPTDNGWINCTKFTDANGKEYNNWIPAIRLW
ncbi:MAG: outer membrane protein assembly factor BamB family protein [Candidatus Methanospirareceae archaeon]